MGNKTCGCYDKADERMKESGIALIGQKSAQTRFRESQLRRYHNATDSKKMEVEEKGLYSFGPESGNRKSVSVDNNLKGESKKEKPVGGRKF